MRSHRLVLAIVAICVFIFSMSFQDKREFEFHTKEEIDTFKKMGGAPDLIEGENDLFMASFRCAGCHGFDPTGVALVDTSGNDINLSDDWRASMMANAAKDPYWRAKVSHEVLVNPSFQNEIETKCTSCHAPLGHHNAMFLGEDHYSIEDLEADSIAFDGVSCNACHQQNPEQAGNSFSGQQIFDTLKVYGPYTNPFAAPMVSFVGYEPLYHEFIERSEVCADCHTLVTETISVDGSLTGGSFIEQATYHEWLNSDYNAEEGSIECQGCHMPKLEQEVIIASGNIFYPTRSPYYMHGIVGGNAFMLKMLQSKIAELDLRASEMQFQEIIDKTETLLAEETMDLFLTENERTTDTLFVELELISKAGHKVPSGYPSRRVFVEFVAKDELGDTIFRSGLLDENYALPDIDDEYEPHHNVINSEDQVQIYEMVMADTEGMATTILLHANEALKDNRIPPLGFSSSHPTYDTVLVAGLALNDPNFNKDDLGIEGTGSDKVYFHIPINGYEGDIFIETSVYFQSVPPEWLEQMFEYSSAEIDTFQTYFDEADKTPFLIGSEDLVSSLIDVDENEEDRLEVFPNPTSNGFVFIDAFDIGIEKITVYDIEGRVLKEVAGSRRNDVLLELPGDTGVYLLLIETSNAKAVKKVLYY
ncbi:MAG: T9SS type A sorting domain-containing protein [Flavobacteriales bacterium]|nr:T9SS type A sorting domain-containing protein [Flavobacteriales bacterium]